MNNGQAQKTGVSKTADETEVLKVAFYHYSESAHYSGNCYNECSRAALGRIAVAAVRKAMPHAHIVHLAGPDIPLVGSDVPTIGADEVLRYPEFNRFRHHALMGDGNTIFLDVDVIVQKDLSFVFDLEFDAAFCIDAVGYRGGIYFSRSQAFWTRFAEFWEWTGRRFSDIVLGQFIAQTTFRVIDLPCSRYNHFPDREDEDVSDRAVVHYKGPKKEWMLRRVQ